MVWQAATLWDGSIPPPKGEFCASDGAENPLGLKNSLVGFFFSVNTLIGNVQTCIVCGGGDRKVRGSSVCGKDWFWDLPPKPAR